MAAARATAPTPALDIEEKTRNELEVFTESLGKSTVYQSVRILASEISQEYGNRFLVELIQNAHDAHPPTSGGGHIHIRLDSDEGQHGVLYVANTGKPFGPENFRALCNIGLSSKRVDEGIGNKGLGFRSVLQVSLWPEIYSKDPANPTSATFDGYCFRFATAQDIRRLLLDEDVAEAAINDVSPYCLPVPQEPENETVIGLGRQAFVTVVRLPLTSARAREAAEEQIAAIQALSAPMLLFLERISQLSIESVSDGTSHLFELRRKSRILPGWQGDLELRLEEVDLGDQGEFLLASRGINHDELMASVQESVEAGRLRDSWLDWRGEARVAVAVPMSGMVEAPILYNFLPMGPGASSPFAGYLNAPFSTRTDRTSLLPDVPLNSFLFDAAADLCARLILCLRDQTRSSSREAIADLVSWGGGEHERIQRAFATIGQDLWKIQILPILPTASPDERHWGSFEMAWRWPGGGFAQLHAENIVKWARVELLDEGLGQHRLERLTKFIGDAFNVQFSPGDETVAEWAERIAAGLHKVPMRAPKWGQLYDDLAVHFRGKGERLAGRKLLLGEDGRLHRCGGARQDGRGASELVFFQPRQSRTEGEEELDPAVDVRVPAALRRRLCFIHPDIQWYVTEGRQTRRKESRTFFEDHRLVRGYDTRELLEQLSRIMRKSKSQPLWQDALRWTYNLRKAARYSRAPELGTVQLRVPSTAGWVPAKSALFSAGWPGTVGAEMARFIDEAGSTSEEVAELGRQLLVSPDDWPFAIDDLPSWADFLRRVGVRDGLWPQEIGPANLERYGYQFDPRWLADDLGLGETEVAEWEAGINGQSYSSPRYPYTPYRAASRFSHLPGQSAYDSLSEASRKLFARLILHGLNLWPESCFSVDISRQHSTRRDTFHRPTPLANFLSQRAWLPMARPGQRDTWDFYRPRNAWHVSEGFLDQAPSFAPLIPTELRRQLKADSMALSHLVNLFGMKVWDDPEHAADLIRCLGSLLEAQVPADTQVDAFRKAYSLAWHHVIGGDQEQRLGIGTPPYPLVVTRGEALEALSLRTEESPQAAGESDPGAAVHVVDTDDELRVSLLQRFERPLLDVGPNIGEQVARILQGRFGDQVRRVSEVQFDVLVDGAPFAPSDGSPLLLGSDLEWLATLVALAVEFQSPLAWTRSERVKQQVLDKLRRVRLKQAMTVATRIDGRELDLPAHLDRAVALDDERYPALVLAREPAPVDWDTLQSISRPLGQLLGYRALGETLRAATFSLAKDEPGDGLTPPSDESLARAFGRGLERVQQVRQGLRGSLARALEFLRPIVLHFAGPGAADRLSIENEALTSQEAVLPVLDEYKDLLPMTPRELLTRCVDADDFGTLRDTLGIPYQQFNDALRGLGPPYVPISNVDGQAQAFRYFTNSKRDLILASLRDRFLADFEAGRGLSDYVRMREELSALPPDSAWLDQCHLPDDELMERRVDAWLASVAAPPLSDVFHPPASADDLRRENREHIAQIAGRLARIIPAWCEGNKCDTPAIWSDVDGATGAVAEEADQTGILEFRPLDDGYILEWLSRRGHWPTSMPLTAELSALGLSEQDLQARETETERVRREKAWERQSIEFDGERRAADPGNYPTIARIVIDSLSEDFLSSSPRASKLALVHTSARGRSQGPDRPPPRGKRPERQSDSQRNAIGFIGEVAALEWLKRHYPHVNDDCWRSTFRACLLGGDPGDDSLGYDFIVVEKRRTLFFEVKASSGDSGEIELGQSEVERAQRCARDSSRRYAILYLTNVGHSQGMAIHVLPNPFSERGRPFFRLVGAGMKYRFTLVG